MRERGRDKEHQRYVQAAVAGDETMAWVCVFLLADVLDDMSETAIEDADLWSSAAEFFAELYEIRKQHVYGIASKKQLSAALKLLKVAPRLGRPKPTASGLDESAEAWCRIGRIHAALATSRDHQTLAQYAAGFFRKLIAIRECHPRQQPPLEQLAEAFEALHVVRRRGERAKLTEQQIVAWIAREKLERKKQPAIENARETVATRGKSTLRLRDLRTAHPDLVALVDTLEEAELRALAESTLDPDGLSMLRGT